MTNINCSSNCKYQKDGKCNLDVVQTKKFIGNINTECIYFVKK